MNVLISVIVPVFNVENYIVECIKSLSKQTHLDFELIIVDDGSTDQSINLIEKELKKFKRKKIIKQKNMGLAEARNVGIANCTGHYVTFVDSDDTISKDYIEIFKKSLLKNKADIIIANHIVKRNKKEIHSYDYFSDSKSEIFKKFLACRVSSSACAKLYKKSLFIKYKVSFPKGYLFEDVATTYKLVYFSSKIDFTDNFIYFYNQKRESSITNNITKKSIDFLLRIFHDTKTFLKENKIYNEFECYFAERCLIQLIVKFSQLKDNKNKRIIIQIYKESGYFDTENLLLIKNSNFNLYMKSLKFILDFFYEIKLEEKYKILFRVIDTLHVPEQKVPTKNILLKNKNNNCALIIYKPFKSNLELNSIYEYGKIFGSHSSLFSNTKFDYYLAYNYNFIKNNASRIENLCCNKKIIPIDYNCFFKDKSKFVFYNFIYDVNDIFCLDSKNLFQTNYLNTNLGSLIISLQFCISLGFKNITLFHFKKHDIPKHASCFFESIQDFMIKNKLELSYQ